MGGDFVVRIEDTDKDRTVDGAVDFIYKSLDWLGITPDADTRNPDSYGPYNQMARDYSHHIKYLLDNDLVYYAFDTKDDLDDARNMSDASGNKFIYNHTTRDSMKNSLSMSKDMVDKLIKDKIPYVIRFKIPRNIDVIYDDVVYGTIKVNSDTIDDKILVKSDGIPTYHLANVCDDHDMDITHVIRGNDWLPSTPLHCLLYDAFKWDRPIFVHLSLIVDKDGKKISKRMAKKYGYSVYTHRWTDIADNGDTFTLDGFADLGYDAPALVDFLSLLGWSPKDDTDIMTMDDLISRFDLNAINKANAKFDIDRLNWMNSKHLNDLDPNYVVGANVDHNDYAKAKLDYYTDDKIKMIADLALDRATFRKDFKPVVDIFFNPISDYIDYDKVTDDYKKVMTDVLTKIDDSHFTDGIDDVKDLIYKCSTANDVKFGVVMKGLRVAITGGISGPDLMTTMYILGHDDSINRIKSTL